MERRQVGVVAALWRHPVKSMLGEQLAEVEITERGAIGDRVYALRELATNLIVSAKKFPRMFEFRAACEGVSTPGACPTVCIRLPDGRAIHAEDPDASELISAALGKEVRIERADTAQSERAGIDPGTVFGDVPVENVRPGLTLAVMPDYFALAPGTFFDSAVMHVIASGTLRHLSKLAGEASGFDPRRFRPTIYVETGEGAGRFVEDEWEGGVLAVGDSVKIAGMRAALRCVMTTHPQDELGRDYRVLRTAASSHNANVGVFASVAASGVVRIGDGVFLEK